MRIVWSAVIALVMGTGCASKSTTVATPVSNAATTSPTSGAASAAQGGRGSAGVQAAARMTPEQLDAAMKTINTANGTLGTKLMGGDLPGAARDAQTLASTFADVERFWAQANKQDAVMLAQRARTAASEIAAAATAGNGPKAMTARGTMTATCMQCHGVYREGDVQAGYRIKAGAI